MTNRDGGQFTKRVEFKAIDEDRQIATGVVFVPDKVDLHGDFARAELIEEWSTDYMRRLQSADEPAEGGVMHTAFPDNHVSLVENTILDEDRTIGGTDVPAGSWVQSWQYHDGELWSLVEDGVFEGYSIGGQEMSWSDPMDLDELPDDVAVAADYDGDQARELLAGFIWEVSSVDIPAVPDARILATKGLEKALPQGKEEFIAEMDERGHSEDEAERLYRYLARITGGTMSASSGPGWLSRAKAFFTTGEGSGVEATKADGDSQTSSKESRTLSAANRRRAMAMHDLAEDLLASEVDFKQNRFTDNDDFGFSLEGKSASVEPASSDGETSGTDKNDMSDTNDDDPFDDAPQWAKAMRDAQKENSEQIKELKEADADDDDDDDDDDDKDAFDDAPEWAKALQEETQQNAKAIEEIGKQTGTSQQLPGSGEGGEGGEGAKSGEPGLDSPDMASKLFNVPVAED